jgi:hypothetical protein
MDCVVRDLGEAGRAGKTASERTPSVEPSRLGACGAGLTWSSCANSWGTADYTVLRQYLALVEADLKQAHQQHSPLNNLRKRERKRCSGIEKSPA